MIAALRSRCRGSLRSRALTMAAPRSRSRGSLWSRALAERSRFARALAMSALVAGAIAGCGHASAGSSAPASNHELRADDPCELVQAMLSIDDTRFQRFYANARRDPIDDTRPSPDPTLVVQVRARAELFPAATRCPGRSFVILHDDVDVKGWVVQFDVGPRDGGLAFGVSLEMPVPRETPGGGFDSAQCYCHLMSGRLQRRDGHWHAFSASE